MPGKLQLEPLFRGSTTAGALRTLALFLQEQGEFDRYVVPCAGNFTVPETLAGCGVPTAKIHTGDITLYSSVLGHLVDPQRSTAELGFQCLSSELKLILDAFPSDTEEQRAAQILFAIKWAQLSKPGEYLKWRQTEMAAQAPAVFGKYASALLRLGEKLGGVTYRQVDAHEQTEEEEARAVAGERVLIWYNPPGYAGGYTKMFDPRGVFSWKAPEIPELKPKEAGPFIVKMAGFKATALVYATEGRVLEESPEGAWIPLYSEITIRKSPAPPARTYVLSNMPSKVSVINRRRFRLMPENPAPIYDDHEITQESEISWIRVDMDTALYYYDLFTHELGITKAERYYLFCLDGQVAGAAGFWVRPYMKERDPTLYETFGLSVTSMRYARLGRLLMAALCCREFTDQFCRDSVPECLLLSPLENIRTTCLTKYPEAKKNRGILKLVSREQLPNGRFHLVYRTAIHERGFKEVVAEWVKKHAKHTRSKEASA